MTTSSRKGMLGALMDEYERASIDLKNILATLSVVDFEKIRDEATSDPDCKSIQTVIFHVVQSGYTYANYIDTISGEKWNEYDNKIATAQQGIQEIDKMLVYTNEILTPLYNRAQEVVESWPFKVRWGVTYGIEQLLEHAIVHILRHRRQIEHFLLCC